MTSLTVLIAFAMSALAPNRDHVIAAEALERAVSNVEPLFAHDASRLKTAALVVSVAFRESSFRNDARSDTGDSCLMQIHGRPELADDIDACLSTAIEMLRSSMATCGADNVLGAYATGSCRSERGRRISRDRMALARRILPE